MIDRMIAALLGSPRLMRLPIPMYRRGLGWLLGRRLVMIEHRGRSSGEARFAVVEVVEREGRVLRVASGFGAKAQWYRNLRANGVAFLSTGRVRRQRVGTVLLDRDASREVLERYGRRHPTAWKRLHDAMAVAQGGEPDILVVEFVPFEGPARR